MNIKKFKNKTIFNLLFSLFGSFSGYLISIIMVKGQELGGYGEYNLFITKVTLLSLILSFGFKDLLLRDSYLELNEKKQNFIEILLKQAILIVILLIIFIFLNKKINIIELKLYYFSSFLFVTFISTIKIFISGYMISSKKYSTINFIENIIFKVVFVVILSIGILLKIDIIKIVTIKTIVELLIILFVLISKEKIHQIPLRIFENNYLNKSNVKYSFFLMLHQLTDQGIFSIDKLVIAKYLTQEDVGGYSFALILSNVIMIVPGILRSRDYPIFSKVMKENRREELKKIYQSTQKEMLDYTLPIIITMCVFSNEILFFFDKKLEPYNLILIYLTLSSFSNIYFGFNGTIINLSKYYKFQFYSKIIFIILIIISDVYFIKKYGVNGSAIATFICFMLYNALKTLLVYKKEGILPFSKANLLQLIVSLTIVILLLIIKCFIYLNIYFISLIILLEYVIFYFFNKKLNKKYNNLEER